LPGWNVIGLLIRNGPARPFLSRNIRPFKGTPRRHKYGTLPKKGQPIRLSVRPFYYYRAGAIGVFLAGRASPALFLSRVYKHTLPIIRVASVLTVRSLGGPDQGKLYTDYYLVDETHVVLVFRPSPDARWRP
jgi:hypothetical protein